MNKLVVLLASALLTFGCVSAIGETDDADSQDNSTGVLPVFKAGFEDMLTRTSVDSNLHLSWTADDRLTIFYMNTSNAQYRFDGETGDNSGSFEPVGTPPSPGNELAANYAVYPYSPATAISNDGVITLTLPSEEAYGENSFGVNANTMVAVTENTSDFFLRFKNVCGYLVFKFYGVGTISSITLTGRNGEKLAGEADVTAVYGGVPSLSIHEGTSTETIVLKSEEGVTIGESADKATTFWFVVPPVTFSNGFSITVTDVNGASASFQTTKQMVISRNSLSRMAGLMVDFSTTPPTFDSNGIDALDESDFEW